MALSLGMALLVSFVATASADHAVRLVIEPSETCIVQGGGIDFVVRAVDAGGQTAIDTEGGLTISATPSAGVTGQGLGSHASLQAGVHTFDPDHGDFGGGQFAVNFANTGTYTLTATSGTLTGSVQIQVVTNLAQCQTTPTTTTTMAPTTTTMAPTTTTMAPTTTT
ncbi:MAG: hypothetical protein M3404_05195, partial [Actinomycetota bacterium]|nr:hypothetical protein [Actinomycetota bacterium]